MTKLAAAMCGSFCTFDKVFAELERLRSDYELIPIMSENAAGTDTRFGSAKDNIKRFEDICARAVIKSVEAAEPVGPKERPDAMLIAPCTGCTLAKLACGVSDTAVTMAAKAHLRNEKPLILAFSTNDALSGSAENIGKLLNRKNVYIVPFRQDDPAGKPRSAQSDFSLIPAAIVAALEGRQLQPILCP